MSTSPTSPQLVQVAVASRVLQLSDLGSPLMQDILELYRTHYTNAVFDASELFVDSFAFFDANYQNTRFVDAYFENFSILWNEFMDNGKYIEAARLLAAFPLRIAYSWEKSNNKVLHKGTPYYFMGVSKVASDDLDEGFLYFHQALEEDKRTYGVSQPPTPAYAFVTLDFNQNQFFVARVKQISAYLDQHIAAYRSQSGSTLTLADLKRRFLGVVQIEEAVFSFVVLLHKLFAHSVLDQRLKKNTMATLQDVNLLFSLLLVIDATIRNKDTLVGDKLFRDFMIFLSKNSKPTLNIRDADLKELTGKFENDFQGTLRLLVASKYTPTSGTKFTAIEEDIAIAHGLRNLGAHRIEFQPSITDNFEEILQRMLNLLFFSVEQFYP